MIFIVLDIAVISLLLIIFFLLIITRKKKKKLVKNRFSKYAIIIPARDESEVITRTLDAIKIQNKKMDNTYVIIEDKKDPTYKIAEEYGANVYIRKKPIKHTKGNAIDECIKEILKNKHYDLYFILDADNIIEKDFIKKMLAYWKEGYEVASAYRNTLNANTWVSISSGLLFAAQNVLLNRYRKLFNLPLILCGSGFYIDGRVIEKLGGFPFFSLTEDFEVSLYIEDNNLSNKLALDCMYLDEQPLTLKASINQRVRWLKGVFTNTKKRKKSLTSTLYDLTLSLAALLLVLFSIELIFLFGLLKGLLLIYLVTMLITIITLMIDNERIRLNNFQKIKCIIFNPLFLYSYIICVIKALFKKDITWTKTKHTGGK